MGLRSALWSSACLCLLRSWGSAHDPGSLHLCHDLWFWWGEKESQDPEIWIRLKFRPAARHPLSSHHSQAPAIFQDSLLITSFSLFALHCYTPKPGQGHGISITPCAFLTQSSCYTRFDVSACCLAFFHRPWAFWGARIKFSSLYLQYYPK